MRETKYRVYNKTTKEMLSCDEVQLSWLPNGSLLVNGDDRAGENGNLILMQYTGLKDKNGVEIYEGDIIRLDQEWADSISADRLNCLVGFHEASFMTGRGIDYNRMNSYLWMQQNYCEVIGNIHQNKELIEV